MRTPGRSWNRQRRHRWRRWFVAILACVLRVGVGVDGQKPADPPRPPAFRSGVDLVSLHVTVTDQAQRYVTTLGRDDFVILEDGKPQDLTMFGLSEVPLALAVVLDSSDSMLDHLATAQEAAVGFVRELRARDVAAIIEFDTQAQILSSFTGDHAALESAIRQAWPDGGTALYDAVYIAVQEFDKLRRGDTPGEARRQAIVLLSDGEDTSSIVGLDDALKLAKRAGVVIYAIGIGTPPRDPRDRRARGPDFALRRLADETGGRAFFARRASDLTGVYQEITKELSSQYVLGYASTNPRRDGHWRRIAVEVRREHVIARTKPGYYAAKP